MKKIAITCLIITIFLFSTCSRNPSNSSGDTGQVECSGKIDVTYDTGFGNIMVESFDVRFATWSRTQQGDFVQHAVCLRNSYITGAKHPDVNHPLSPKTVGQPAEICVTIDDKSGTVVGSKRDSAISPGEYKQMGSDTTKESYLPERLVGGVGYLQNGTVDVRIDSRHSAGWVKINSSTAKTIDGEISFGDGKNKFAGKFIAVTE